MTDPSTIKAALERTTKAVTRQPSVGQGAEKMRVNVAADGSCTAVDGDTSMVIDMGTMWGGNGTTPSPGFYVRASLGACLAQGYIIHAAARGIVIDEISVDIENSYDVSGNLGINDAVPVSYESVRYTVNIRSPAPEEKIMEALDYSDAHDFVRDVFARAISLKRSVNIIKAD